MKGGHNPMATLIATHILDYAIREKVRPPTAQNEQRAIAVVSQHWCGDSLYIVIRLSRGFFGRRGAITDA